VQRPFLKALVLFPTAVVILAAIGTSGAAIIENIRFARATDQILRLVATTHDVALTDKNFASQPNEDLLGELVHGGLISGAIAGRPVTLHNPWNGTVTSMAMAPSVMRIETNMPARDCRRLALFFVKNGTDLGLNFMETHEDAGKTWHRFYDRASGLLAPSNQPVEAACGTAPQVTLALAFLLR
jgi:hypothetical protein